MPSSAPSTRATQRGPQPIRTGFGRSATVARLVDTNVWLAAADRRSRDHGRCRCRAVLDEHRTKLASTVPVIAETAWLLLDRGGPEHQRRFLSLVTSGRLQPMELTTADWQRVLALVDTYADLRLDAIDAATIAVAERLGLTTVATLDHRDFATVRPAHCDALTLLPAGGQIDE